MTASLRMYRFELRFVFVDDGIQGSSCHAIMHEKKRGCPFGRKRSSSARFVHPCDRATKERRTRVQQTIVWISEERIPHGIGILLWLYIRFFLFFLPFLDMLHIGLDIIPFLCTYCINVIPFPYTLRCTRRMCFYRMLFF